MAYGLWHISYGILQDSGLRLRSASAGGGARAVPPRALLGRVAPQAVVALRDALAAV